MSNFEALNKYWTSYGPNAGHIASMREPDSDKLEHLYEEDDEDLKKGKRGSLFHNDPMAAATAAVKKKYNIDDYDMMDDPNAERPSDGPFGRNGWAAPIRDRVAENIKREWAKKKGGKGRAKPVTAMQLSDNMNVEKISPGLERLLAFGAGWALSGDIANKDVPADLVREYERAINNQASEAERRRLERKIRSRVRKSDDVFMELNDFYLQKEHAPIPPRAGLMWDAVKHRWTRPERVGRTVWELSGHKRIRGTGTGVHERSIKVGGVGGRGAGSASAGRRFRSIGDSGKLHPHEARHPAFRRLKAFRRRRQAVDNKTKR